MKQGEKKNNRKIGSEYEQKTIEKLEKIGYQIIEKNYWCRIGEIDVIAKQGGYLVFIEVKYRKNDKKGSAAEAVTFAKQTKIKKVAKYYLMTHFYKSEASIRFDVVAIDGEQFTLYQNAFSFY